MNWKMLILGYSILMIVIIYGIVDYFHDGKLDIVEYKSDTGAVSYERTLTSEEVWKIRNAKMMEEYPQYDVYQGEIADSDTLVTRISNNPTMEQQINEAIARGAEITQVIWQDGKIVGYTERCTTFTISDSGSPYATPNVDTSWTYDSTVTSWDNPIDTTDKDVKMDSVEVHIDSSGTKWFGNIQVGKPVMGDGRKIK